MARSKKLTSLPRGLSQHNPKAQKIMKSHLRHMSYLPSSMPIGLTLLLPLVLPLINVDE